MSEAENDLRSKADADGVEFFFAMFVDMHGKPCAKMVPIEAFDVLMGGGAGFAGFAAGPMGQSPANPDMIAVPDPASYTLVPWQPGLAVVQCDIAVEGEPWPYTPRVILRRSARSAPRTGAWSQGRAARPSTSCSPASAAAASRSPIRSTRLRRAVLRREGADPDVRPPDDHVEVHEPARLGELRQRPRGRQRSVRAEFRLRRRADERRPRDLLPLHGAHRSRTSAGWPRRSCPSRSPT